MGDGPMRTLLRVGHQPHPIDRKKYGQPRFALYWANPVGFVHPGLHVWTGSRNHWVFPLPKSLCRFIARIARGGTP